MGYRMLDEDSFVANAGLERGVSFQFEGKAFPRKGALPVDGRSRGKNFRTDPRNLEIQGG